jgi:hypothetical protein
MNADETPIDFKEKLRSIGVMRRTDGAAREPRLARDRDAYRRLRMEGLQPPTVNGSAELEATMDHPHEAEMGRAFPRDRFPDRAATWKQVDEANEHAAEMEEFRQRVIAEQNDG